MKAWENFARNGGELGIVGGGVGWFFNERDGKFLKSL